MITIEKCRVVYPSTARTDRPALDDVSVAVAAGSFVTVVGSNGAGKSTLLRLISGAVLPERGRVTVAGKDVTGKPIHERAGAVAQVFQDPLAGTCGNLSIAENFAIASRRGGSRGFRRAVNGGLRRQAAEALAPAQLGLEGRLSTAVGELSGGQRQVIALAMATVAGSSVLLLDEHTAALDPHTAVIVMTMTERVVSQRGLTVLMVTHSLEQALRYGDRTLMLHEGRIVLDITGPERSRMDVADLLALFRKKEGHSLTEDRLLLGASRT
jgi:putative tryptophan/tyrosine transport system ATP-binding protein